MSKAPEAKPSGVNRKNKLEDLKKELELDDHKLDVKIVCARYQSDPDKVNDILKEAN